MKYFINFVIILSLFTNCSGTPGNTAQNTQDSEITEIAAVVEVEDEVLQELPPIFIAQEGSELPVTSFREIWGYVVAGRESSLLRGLPITDVGYFGAEVNSYGTLVGVPNRRAISWFTGKVHLVVACNGNALSYFTLMEGSPQRAALIEDLIAATRNFDGLQIDFENIPARARESYHSFLIALREGLPDKMFTVALAARTRKIANDTYDYETILPYVDRILVMAYDEHWSTSRAGPVASTLWCRNVANYCKAVIGEEKLVMGLPLYGRAWVDVNHHRALVFSTTDNIIKTHGVENIRRENGIPTFDYQPTINVKVYYDDEYSISTRMEMYKSMGINAIGFWRIGQETQKVWDIMQISND